MLESALCHLKNLTSDGALPSQPVPVQSTNRGVTGFLGNQASSHPQHSVSGCADGSAVKLSFLPGLATEAGVLVLMCYAAGRKSGQLAPCLSELQVPSLDPQ